MEPKECRLMLSSLYVHAFYACPIDSLDTDADDLADSHFRLSLARPTGIGTSRAVTGGRFNAAFAPKVTQYGEALMPDANSHRYPLEDLGNGSPAESAQDSAKFNRDAVAG